LTNRAPALVVALLACCLGSSRGGEPMLYVIEGDRLIFTNIPSRANARPVPGLSGETGARAAAPRLPPTIFDAYIERVARENGLSPDLIKAVALVESGLDPQAVSPKGAQGLMQLMPETARRYGVTDAFNPLDNLAAGAQYLRGLLDEFDGDLKLALAAYNAGPGAVRRHGGVPAYTETLNYVRKVHEKLGRRVPRMEPASQSSRPIEYRVLSDGSVLFSNQPGTPE